VGRLSYVSVVLDSWYVDHHNFWLELKILLLTFTTVRIRDGISAPGDATMPEFFGSDNSRKANAS